MKKFKSLLLGLVLILALTACGSKSAETKPVAKATFEQNGVNVEMLFYAEADKITKIEQKSTVDFAKLDESQKKIIEANSKTAKELYSNIKGTEYKTETKDNILTETISMNVGDPTTLKALIAAKLLPTSSDNVSSLSLSATKESLSKNGFKVEDLK